jgi:eukaryotic-like serine/threonine-protein kinase
MLLGQQVAVKVLRRDYADDPARLRRFREATSRAAAVSHPSVARVRDYGAGGPDAAPYLVTEFIEGPALAEIIAGEAVRPSLIAKTLAQVAEGLHAAHQAGLVHGDLKPANILLPAAGDRATVTDFAITHALDAIPRAGLTPGTLHGTGTVLYLAPERVSGGPGSPAGDLYSLGIIAHEWLTGTPPFTGTSQQVLAAHLRAPLPRLPSAVPPGLARLVARLADKDPEGRFPDADEVAAAARALAIELREGGQGDVARFPMRLQKAPDPVPTRAQAAIAAARPGDEAARFRLSGLAAHKREIAWAASALVLAGLIGWAPSAPVQSAVKIVQLAIPAARHQAGPAGHRAAGREHPGKGGGGYQAPGSDGHRLGESGASQAARDGNGGYGRDGGPGLASGDQASVRAVGAGPRPPGPAPAPTAAGGPAGSSPSPCPRDPASPRPSPTSPASPTSHPPAGPGPQPPSAPASRPPTPAPPVPLPIPVISVSVPPLTAPLPAPLATLSSAATATAGLLAVSGS